MGAENPPSQTGRHACRRFRSSRKNGRRGKVEPFVPLSKTPASGGRGHFPAGILPTEQSGLKRLPAGERIATENSCRAGKRDESGDPARFFVCGDAPVFPYGKTISLFSPARWWRSGVTLWGARRKSVTAFWGESGPIMSINCRKTIKISFSQDGENGFFTLLYSDNLPAGL